LSTLLCFSFKTGKWNELLKCPFIEKKSTLVGCSSQIFKNEIYIYGGSITEKDFGTNRMFCYSIENNKWREIIFPGNNQSITFSPSMIYQNYFVTFGGRFDRTNVYLYDIVGMQFKTFDWKSIFNKSNLFEVHFRFE
jgi:hypothetical protein